MTKKKDKKGKGHKTKAAKSKTAKLPKEIAGVKVPKQLREPGGKLLEAVRHPLVMDIAAAALMAAAAGLRKGSAPAADAAAGKDLRGKVAGDIGALLTATALEGVKRLGDAAAKQARGNGAQEPSDESGQR